MSTVPSVKISSDTSSDSSHVGAPLFWLPVVLLAALALWLIAGRIVLIQLGAAVPLSASDLTQISWLNSKGTALHFSSGFFGVAIPALLLTMGSIMALTRGSIFPLLVAGTLSFVLGFGDGEADAARIGILDDVTKVGCFVDSAECRAMLGLEKGSAPSMLATPAEREQGKVYADWYVKARQTASPALEGWGVISSMPGGWILRAPLYWNSAEALKQKLKVQKEALTKYNASH